jgi:hypothetical protein
MKARDVTTSTVSSVGPDAPVGEIAKLQCERSPLAGDIARRGRGNLPALGAGFEATWFPARRPGSGVSRRNARRYWAVPELGKINRIH